MDQIIDPSQTTSLQFLRSGTDVAFVISGFIMSFILIKRPQSPWEFLLRRVVRIVPLYWAVTSLMVVMMIFLPNLLQTARFDAAHVMASYLFLPWLNPADGAGIRPVFMPGWTLNFEMYFYVLIAVALFIRHKIMRVIVGAAFVISVAINRFTGPAIPVVDFYANPLLIEFAIGFGITSLMGRIQNAPRITCITIVLLGLGLLSLLGNDINPDESNRLFVFGFPIGLIVGGMVFLERQAGMPNIGFLRLAGDASYSIYLTHTLLLSALAQVWKHAGLVGWLPKLFVCAALTGSLVLGIGVHVFIERHITIFLMRRLRGTL
jgi:exopolysaccharide production protein ExoZ